MRFPPGFVRLVATAALVLAVVAGLVGEQWGTRGVLWLLAGFLAAGFGLALWAEVANWRDRRGGGDDPPPDLDGRRPAGDPRPRGDGPPRQSRDDRPDDGEPPAARARGPPRPGGKATRRGRPTARRQASTPRPPGGEGAPRPIRPRVGWSP